eukprot:4710843-Pleurochrysis_carterae.AAC.1
MRAGPARRSFEQCLRSDTASSVHMLVVRFCRKRFREDVRHVVVRSNPAHLDASVRHVLSHLQVAS